MANEASVPEAKPGRFARFRTVGLAVLLLAMGGGAGFGGSRMLGGAPAADAADADPGEAEAEPGKDDGDAGGGHGEPAPAGHGEPAPAGHGEPAPAGHGEPGASPKAIGARAVVNLGMFIVNLRGNGGGRVLRTEVQVEVQSQDQSAIEERKALLRDAVITLVSDYTYADLEGVDGKTHLRDELVGRLNSVLSSQPPVDRLYFTEFVVQ